MDGFFISIALVIVGAFIFVRLRPKPGAITIKAPTIAFIDVSPEGEFSELLIEDRKMLKRITDRRVRI